MRSHPIYHRPLEHPPFDLQNLSFFRTLLLEWGEIEYLITPVRIQASKLQAWLDEHLKAERVTSLQQVPLTQMG